MSNKNLKSVASICKKLYELSKNVHSKDIILSTQS